MKSIVIEIINRKHSSDLKDVETITNSKINHYFPNKLIFSYSISNRQKWHGNQGFHNYLAISDCKEVFIDVSIKELFENHLVPIKNEKDLTDIVEIYCALAHAVVVNSKEELIEKFSQRGANPKEDLICPPSISASKSEKGNCEIMFFAVSGRADIVSLITISFDIDGKVFFKSDHISTKSPRK
jgi:hypothetical protein